MKKSAAAIALSAALLGSSIVGIRILTTDSWLWSAASTHAYGLIAFVILDGAAIVAIWKGVRLAGPFAVILAAVQFLAMAGDLAGLSVPAGTSASGLRAYLLSDSPFVALMLIQPAIAGLGVLSRKKISAPEQRKESVS